MHGVPENISMTYQADERGGGGIHNRGGFGSKSASMIYNDLYSSLIQAEVDGIKVKKTVSYKRAMSAVRTLYMHACSCHEFH